MSINNIKWGIITFVAALILAVNYRIANAVHGSIKGAVINIDSLPLIGANGIRPNLQRGTSANKNVEFTIEWIL